MDLVKTSGETIAICPKMEKGLAKGIEKATERMMESAKSIGRITLKKYLRGKINLKGNFDIDTVDNGYIVSIWAEGYSKKLVGDNIGFLFEEALDYIQGEIDRKEAKERRYYELKEEFEG